MKINWKVRLQNKTFLLTMATAIIAFVYQLLAICGIVPVVSESDVTQLVLLIVNILVSIGIVVDPTTKGIDDSDRAMLYDEPQ